MSLRDIVANVVSIPQRRYVACFFGGGSPRPVRAWPLAWPAPSGPLGWQRLQGQGSARRDATGGSALDAGGASPDNARRSGLARCYILTAPGALDALLTAWSWCWRARQRGTAADRGWPVTGVSCAAADAPGGLPPKGRGEKLPPRNGETPG
jgi:hypothetical protein